jgi:(2S)-methylsuccinyl-CoA dehydrogenase
MTTAAKRVDASPAGLDRAAILRDTEAALGAASRLADAAKTGVRALLASTGQNDASAFNKHQYAAHGYAWLATYVRALEQFRNWAVGLEAGGRFGDLEAALLLNGFGEYLAQMAGGIALSQGEVVRPADMNVSGAEIEKFHSAAQALMVQGTDINVRLRIAESVRHSQFGDLGLDETYQLIFEQFRRFATEEVEPFAHAWHLNNEYIPMELIAKMSEMGVFGLTIPEEFGGHGMSKLAMALVSEELSRGYIGVGSLGTRSEIAAELIRLGGTKEQKEYWLPKIASGEIIPTAVFTEPNVGSDLGSLRTRAERQGDVYKVTGNKTWITHAARADVMMLLTRTSNAEGYRGLSMLLAPKPRGDDANPFPAKGMTGGEIHVLGYRGMKEFEIGFDGFEVPAANLLGGVEGQGFKQLMATFESARVQTGARAVGVAQCAMELGLKYALERVQFGEALIEFPRIAAKLAWMATETMIARQITYFAARQKDSDRRCDIEAGMAKLLGARTAWSNADNALQIHGGNGYALEYPISRVLCDARILNIFEGAAEIQAQVIARGLLA